MIKVFYSDKQAVDQGEQSFGAIKSPSAMKPKLIATALKNYANVEIVEPQPLTRDDLKLSHSDEYVDDIIDLREENGFGNKSAAVAESLLYTNGAMYDAAKAATKDNPTCALVSGFHHAGYNRWKGLGYFCTFNGLTITAAKLLRDGYRKIAIVDCDMHWGNGTDNILDIMNDPEGEPWENLKGYVYHETFGKRFVNKVQANNYISWFNIVHSNLKHHKPDIILYQAGADVHVNDPYGGILNTEQMKERDFLMFTFAKELGIPICWNLAGGYQLDKDGGCSKVIQLHLNTFEECNKVYYG